VLGGRYEVHAPLGEGGMATVFRGVDTVLGRPVAVKVLAPRYAKDATFVARFRREAQSAAAMNHPNVVNVYDTGSDRGVHYIVMELVEGRTLREVIREEGPLLPERAAEIAAAVCQALAFAHERGIVHRDVKPGNIMLTPTGEVKVMDFGIARATSGEALTQTATVLGTASYISPEQAQGESVDARSDIYSLGVVLYEMLTRQVPFSGDNPVAIAYKHVQEEAIRPSRLNADVPQPLESIVLKALAKNPANRYQSAAEMLADLQRFLAGQSVQATPLLPPEPTEVIAREARETLVLPATEAGAGPAGRSAGRTAAFVIAVILLLATLGVLFFLLARQIIGDGDVAQVTVPNCVNRRLDACRLLLRQEGLKANVSERRANPDIPAGVVIEQDPAADDTADEGATVDLVVSNGPVEVEVPDLTGKTEDQARQTLEDNDLTLGSVDRAFSPDVEEDHVFRQDPGAGENVPQGSAVDITLSAGQEPVDVPALTGLSPDDAQQVLETAGLRLGTVEEGTCTSDGGPGTICAQDPDPNVQVNPDTEVDVTVQPQNIEVPDLTGMTETEAKQALKDGGLQLGDTTTGGATCISPNGSGTVCAQEPDDGTQVPPGTSVDIALQA